MTQVFNFNNNEVRVTTINGQPWWMAKDVCDVLGLADTHKALQGIDEDEKSEHEQYSGSGRKPLMVNEPGLYSLIIRSRKPEAKAFKRWITHEVLPSIRKTGGYVSDDDLFVNTYLQHADDQTKLMFKATLETVRKQNEKIAIMQPKADFFDAVTDSKDAIDIGTAAKVLAIPGVGRNTLFHRLREKGILMSNNQPYQQYVDRGYFRIIEQKYNKADGSTNISIKTLVYQKGLDFIRKIVEDGK